MRESSPPPLPTGRLSAPSWTSRSPSHPHGPHQLRYGSSEIILLPHGVINQSLYRDGSHKTPTSLSKGKKEKKKQVRTKACAQRQRETSAIFVQQG